jgi:hypothetical protein
MSKGKLKQISVRLPGGRGEQHEFAEEVGPGDGGERADDGGDGVADVDAGLDAELLEDGEEVERVALERGVAGEVEVVRVGGPRAHGVEEHDAVVGDEVRHQVLPHGLVRAEAVRQHDHPALPLPHHPQVVRLLHDPHAGDPSPLPLPLPLPPALALALAARSPSRRGSTRGAGSRAEEEVRGTGSRAEAAGTDSGKRMNGGRFKAGGRGPDSAGRGGERGCRCWRWALGAGLRRHGDSAGNVADGRGRRGGLVAGGGGGLERVAASWLACSAPRCGSALVGRSRYNWILSPAATRSYALLEFGKLQMRA